MLGCFPHTCARSPPVRCRAWLGTTLLWGIGSPEVRHAPGVGSACSRLGRAEPCSAAFPTHVHDPHRRGAEHGSALPGTVVSHSAPDLACYRVDAWASPAIDQDATLPRHAIRPGPASSSREGLCMHACRKTAPLRAPFVYQPCSNDLPHSRCRGVRPARPGPGAAARSVAPAARAGTRPPPRSVRRPVPPAGARPRWLPPPVPHSAGSRHPSVPRSG